MVLQGGISTSPAPSQPSSSLALTASPFVQPRLKPSTTMVRLSRLTYITSVVDRTIRAHSQLLAHRQARLQGHRRRLVHSRHVPHHHLHDYDLPLARYQLRKA